MLIWGPSDLLGRRAPGFKGAVDFFGQNIPSYDLFLIAFSPIVLGVLWLLFQRTRWGVLVRAATQDRDMVAALGVNQKWLFTSVFALGRIPRRAGRRAADSARRRAPRAGFADHRRRVRGGGDRRPRQHHRRLCRRRAGVGTQCLRHPDLSKDLDHPGVSGDGGGADRAALGPVRQAGGAGAPHAGLDGQSMAAADHERAAGRARRAGRRGGTAVGRRQLRAHRRLRDRDLRDLRR